MMDVSVYVYRIVTLNNVIVNQKFIKSQIY